MTGFSNARIAEKKDFALHREKQRIDESPRLAGGFFFVILEDEFELSSEKLHTDLKKDSCFFS
jgi:hypothetical protein